VSGSQKIRGALYYVSVAVFILGLPFILTYTMGYQFDHRTLKFTRTGIISLKTNPPGASVYLGSRLLPEKTPSSINELLPGSYHIRLTMEGFYPYASDAEVLPSKVTRLEKIIMFPLRPDVKKLNQESVSSFWIDASRNLVYYVHFDDQVVFRSEPDGSRFSMIARLLPLKSPAKKWAVSHDGKKLVYYNAREIAIVSLLPEENPDAGPRDFVIVYAGDAIREAVWYSDNYHLIVIGEKQIAIIETRPQAEAVVLASLSSRNAAVSYDPRSEILYFSDKEKAEDGMVYDNVYRLELKTKLYPFKDFLRLKYYDREQKD